MFLESAPEVQITRAIQQTIAIGAKAMVIPLPWFNLPVWPPEAMTLCVAYQEGNAHVDGEGNVNCCLLPYEHEGPCGGS